MKCSFQSRSLPIEPIVVVLADCSSASFCLRDTCAGETCVTCACAYRLRTRLPILARNHENFITLVHFSRSHRATVVRVRFRSLEIIFIEVLNSRYYHGNMSLTNDKTISVNLWGTSVGFRSEYFKPRYISSLN